LYALTPSLSISMAPTTIEYIVKCNFELKLRAMFMDENLSANIFSLLYMRKLTCKRDPEA